ncbi:3'-5' exonuclease [Thiothrix nivea]|uniref:DNA 3'-5' helicase II n=1 Tax=Thiothrix nivea (strain ATCC 35100 / DSM 5205 / JP2) TaxID=870187 RepID=A0A656HEX1_THINJ|nr:3'-5' exonuclease [Thiothrix nivea]EIJ35631.1 NERD domain protein [Thiothrix nivea DSM 5205]
MANLIPSLNSCLSRMTAGEKRFARRLEQLLEDDYLCWYEPRVGEGFRQRYADFVIVHPWRGLLLLEVKDWKLDHIHTIDKVSATLLTNTGLKTVSNPLEQARQCAYKLINQLEKDPQLIKHGGKHQGKLVFPYGYGVVLTNINRQQFSDTDLPEVLPWNRVLCKDEMLENTDPEDFQQCLWNMFDYQFSKPLSVPQIDRIRWHIFPEIRIAEQASLFAHPLAEPSEAEEPQPADTLLPDILKVMDIQQEQLARSLGNGHRVIHGVAGSGKTLILGYRCLYLARLLHKPILVLCYNIALAARLRTLMEEKGINDKVSVYHFHDWCGEQLRAYHIDRPQAQGEAYVNALVDSVIAAVASGRIPRGQYGAIMIDEGHDFEPAWLQLVSGMVDPEQDSLLLLYDDAQSIYHKQKALKFSLSSVGIRAQGRTTILRLNYRNTDEVFRFAYRFARQYLHPADSDEDHVPLLEPQSAGHHSFAPELRLFPSFEDETATIGRWLQHWHKQRATAWADMTVLYRHAAEGRKLHQALQDAGIPCQWLRNADSKKRFNPAEDSVKLMTIHSSKGLEFPLVIIAGVGFIATEATTVADEAKLLYVAMTRSTDRLLLTSHRETAFTQALMTEAETV